MEYLKGIKKKLKNKLSILKFKNMHRGKRAFVIGNGPSLRANDLELIKNEISIASNKIFLIFGKTSWRPTYYSLIDALVINEFRNNPPDIKAPIFCSEDVSDLFVNKNTNKFNLLKDWYNNKKFIPGFSNNLLKGLYGGECVTYANIQILWFMGIKEIILLGVDHSFTLPKKKKFSKEFVNVYENNNECNHFDPNYRKKGELWTKPNLKEQSIAYSYGAQFIEKKGGSLYNASRKTNLKNIKLRQLESFF